jgi:hypothetical protein
MGKTMGAFPATFLLRYYKIIEILLFLNLCCVATSLKGLKGEIITEEKNKTQLDPISISVPSSLISQK